MNELKLYVWDDPYGVSYGSSLFFAVAGSEEEAREIAKASCSYSYGCLNEGDKSWVKLNKPSRVLRVPSGEWHEWSE